MLISDKQELKESIKEALEESKPRITKAEIMAIPDRQKRRQLIAENIDLFVEED